MGSAAFRQDEQSYGQKFVRAHTPAAGQATADSIRFKR